MPQYHDPEYWNLRYKDDMDYFEWYCSYHPLQPLLSRLLSTLQHRFRLPFLNILDVGCGTSTVTRHLIEQHNNLHILAIDQSEACIRFMSHTHSTPKDHDESAHNQSALEYQHIALERLSLKFKGGRRSHRRRYHMVLDKGTIDSMLCQNGGDDIVKQRINEHIFHLLAPLGVLLMITHCPNRHLLFVKQRWKIKRTVVKVPYFEVDHEQKCLKLHDFLTNDIRKYLRENNRILSRHWLPTTERDDYPADIELAQESAVTVNEQKNENGKSSDSTETRKKVDFQFVVKTEEELKAERRRRRLEYEKEVERAKQVFAAICQVTWCW